MVVGAGDVSVVPRAGLPRRKERRQEGRRAGREVAGTGGGSYARLVPGNTEPAEGAHFGCPATRSSAWGRGLQALPAGGFSREGRPPEARPALGSAHRRVPAWTPAAQERSPERVGLGDFGELGEHRGGPRSHFEVWLCRAGVGAILPGPRAPVP